MVRVSIKLLYPFSTCHIPKIFVALLPRLIPDLYAAVVFSPSGHLPLTFVSILPFPALPYIFYSFNASRLTLAGSHSHLTSQLSSVHLKTDHPEQTGRRPNCIGTVASLVPQHNVSAGFGGERGRKWGKGWKGRHGGRKLEGRVINSPPFCRKYDHLIHSPHTLPAAVGSYKFT